MNWSRLKDPPSTSATVLIVSVLARPGTPSSSTWPPASSATSSRSSIPSCPTITRLTSNSAVSSAAWASRAGLSSRPSRALRRTSSVLTLSSDSPVGCGAGWALIPVPAGRDACRVAPRSYAAGRRASTVSSTRSPGLCSRTAAREVLRLLDLAVADGRDPVARAQLGGGGGAGLRDRVDDRAVVVRVERRGDPEVGALDVAALDQLRHDLLDGVDRDGEADAARLARGGRDLRVDADHAALGVEQRAARVAGVDRGVGLQHAGDVEAVGRRDLAVERRDDPRSSRCPRGRTGCRSRSRRRPGAAGTRRRARAAPSRRAPCPGRPRAPRGRSTRPCRPASPAVRRRPRRSGR